MNFTQSVDKIPDCIAAALPLVETAARRIGVGTWKGERIAFTGIGASLHSAHVAARQFRAQGIVAYALSLEEMAETGTRLADRVVILSASGASVEALDLADRLHGTPAIAVSVTAANPLAERVDAVVETGNALESSPSAPSFVCTSVATGVLAELASGALRPEWAGLPGLASRTLAETAGPARHQARQMAGCRSIDVVGPGILHGVAGEIALLLREAARVPAMAFGTRDYLHGPLESLEAGHGLITLGGAREAMLAKDMDAAGALTWHIGADCAPVMQASGHAGIDALLAILPAEQFIAELSTIRGLADAPFRYRQDDTKDRKDRARALQ
ncbi:SIS domain-containing protein [Tropicimonas sp. IMCC34043]|uniref:SIS domain-containing protein n=1 Tax=Tropicimonas sp. IMCC34043 TaxID=2248760 RepID=UPI000E281C67|nr:hypothetical protein [Tropicimonas sp. IMCC34043]